VTQIRKIILSGVFWSTANQIFTQIVGLAVVAVLTRLLSPADFGLVAMVTLATGFLRILKDFGIGAALIQKKHVSHEEYSTVFWLNMALGSLFTIGTFLAAGTIADFYHEPLIIPVTQIMSFTFMVNSAGVVWSNQLVKSVDFKQIFYRNLISVLVSGLLGIGAAFYGLGYWALIVESYAQLILNVYLNYRRSGWVPSFVFQRQYLADLFKFSLPLLGDKSLNYWMRNVDNLLVGRFLGKADLGYYTKAYSLMLLPVRQLSGTITKVLFPSFSLIQDDVRKIASIYLKISRVIAFLAFPVMIALSVFAEPMILIIYGEVWRPVIPLFQVLSLLGMFQAIGTLSGNVYMARAKTLLMFKVGIFSRILMIGGIVVGLYSGGLMGMIYGYCLTSMLAFLPELYFVGVMLEISLWAIIRNFISYFLISCVAGVVVYGIFHYVDLYFIVEFAVGSITFGLIYLALCWLLRVPALKELIQLAANFRRKEK
jgi:O-antigen/teichoic acid export membrane protein